MVGLFTLTPSGRVSRAHDRLLLWRERIHWQGIQVHPGEMTIYCRITEMLHPSTRSGSYIKELFSKKQVVSLNESGFQGGPEGISIFIRFQFLKTDSQPQLCRHNNQSVCTGSSELTTKLTKI